jgi:NNP family nitrate/nitrite transporter-like MFS transporter
MVDSPSQDSSSPPVDDVPLEITAVEQQVEEQFEHQVELEQEAAMDRLEDERRRLAEEWELCLQDPYRASPGSKYVRYNVAVDHDEGDRATEIKIFSTARPHMRAMHCAWISFFLAFNIWFAPAPLLREIQDTLGLTKKQIWTSSITNDLTAIVMRMLIGPICDIHAARLPMAAVLILGSIPTAMVGLVDSAFGLSVVRFFIGISGSAFVMAQFWPTRMFAREISGTANGIVGGWGNLGGAWTQLMMGRILFPIFRDTVYDGDSEKAWRFICIIPAAMALIWGCVLPFISDDAPMGNYAEMKKKGAMDRIFMTTSLRNGASRNTWILYAQYGCSFGVELVMNNAAVLYYTDEFGLTTEEASTIGFLYGSMNIFARACGGILSDRLNLRIGMRGRLWLITILLIFEGIMIIFFAYTKSLGSAVVAMCIFSIFTQAAEGAIYGVVPYVSKLYTGSVAGLVGSGGNAGSVIYGIGFQNLDYRQAFVMMGSIVIASSALSLGIRIPCHAGLVHGEDNHAVIAARERYLRRRELERQQFPPSGQTVETNAGAEEEEEEETRAPKTNGDDAIKVDAAAATTAVETELSPVTTTTTNDKP